RRQGEMDLAPALESEEKGSRCKERQGSAAFSRREWDAEDDQQWPDTLFVTCEYPAYILQYEMRLWSKPKLFGAGEGAVIYGENGWLLLTNTSWKAYDAADKLVKQGETPGARAQQAHIRNFLDAVRSRRRESLNQEIHS